MTSQNQVIVNENLSSRKKDASDLIIILQAWRQTNIIYYSTANDFHTKEIFINIYISIKNRLAIFDKKHEL